MSVTEQPVQPMSDASGTGVHALDPQAALELAHELVLVTRATFAQLLPETASRALSGVPGLGGAATPAPARAIAHQVGGTMTATTAPVIAVPSQAPATAPVHQPEPAKPADIQPVAISLVAAEVPAAEVPDATQADEGINEHGLAIPTVALSVPQSPAPEEDATAYVPVPGVEVPAAVATVKLTAPVPIPAPITLRPTEPATTEGEPAPETSEPTLPVRPFHPNLAMLEEISFLDE